MTCQNNKCQLRHVRRFRLHQLEYRYTKCIAKDKDSEIDNGTPKTRKPKQAKIENKTKRTVYNEIDNGTPKTRLPKQAKTENKTKRTVKTQNS